MSRSSFLIWLGTLSSASAVLLWLLHSGGRVEYPSIGGGGYNLDDFIYSWGLLILTGLWAVIAFLVGLSLADRSSSKRAFLLGGWGTLAMLLTLFLHGSDLS